MTSLASHPRPAARSVARAQVRSARQAMRTEALIFLGFLIVALVLVVVTALRAWPGSQMSSEYAAEGMIPMVAIALFVPLSVWRAEDRSRRAYHWSMPVDTMSHTLLRVYGGWVWLMVGVAAYVLFLEVMSLSLVAITHTPTNYTAAWWEWILALTAPTLAYLFSSALFVGSAHPWRWLLGSVLAWLGGAMLIDVYHIRWLARGAQAVWSGYAGLSLALSGPRGAHRVYGAEDDTIRWLAATALWLLIGAVALVSAARRHPER